MTTKRRLFRELVDALHRRRRRTMHDATATELWHELERGGWAVVDRIDRDQHRYVLARKAAGGTRALTRREREVVEHASRGWSNKLIAYELGVSSSTVSTHLSHAAAKLGARSRTVLIHIFRALAAMRPGVAVEYVESAGQHFAVIAMPLGAKLPASLSPAERAVAALAIAGKSNADIARARGVSRRTIENQLATAMKKLGVTSRAELSAAIFVEKRSLD
jgi:DNA-binding CsgD family transcriptional regulator